MNEIGAIDVGKFCQALSPGAYRTLSGSECVLGSKLKG